MFQHLQNPTFNTTSGSNGYLNSPPSSRSHSDDTYLYSSSGLSASLKKPPYATSKNELSGGLEDKTLLPTSSGNNRIISNTRQQKPSGSNIDISNIHSLDDIQLDDFETAYNMLTELQAQYVHGQIEQLKQMQQQNMLLQKSKSNVSLASLNGYQTGSLFNKSATPNDNTERSWRSKSVGSENANSEHLLSAFMNNSQLQAMNTTKQQNVAVSNQQKAAHYLALKPESAMINNQVNNAQNNHNAPSALNSTLLGLNNELLSENENNALQGFLDDFLADANEDGNDEFDALINGLTYNNAGGVQHNGTNQLNNTYTTNDAVSALQSGSNQFSGTNAAATAAAAATTSTTSDHMYVSNSPFESLNTPHLQSSPKLASMPPVAKSVSPPYKSDSASTTPKQARSRRSRRKLLSEQEKRLNHTSSEKKRRHLIKTSFDNLVGKLPLDELKKQNIGEESGSSRSSKSSSAKMSKFVILDLTGNEIERLKDVNDQLKLLCLNNGVNCDITPPQSTVQVI